MKFLTELKARKAKFGFKLDYLRIDSFIPLGKFLESLQNTYDDKTYVVEMVGMHGTDFRVYTDESSIAEWIRTNWVN